MSPKIIDNELEKTAETMIKSAVKLLIGSRKDFKDWNLEELSADMESLIKAHDMIEQQLKVIQINFQKTTEELMKKLKEEIAGTKGN